MKKNLVEFSSPVKFRILGEQILNEKKPDEVALKVELKWQMADKINNNNRRYRREILQREIERIQPDLAEGKVIGCGYHPKEGLDASLPEVVMIYDSLKMKDDGSCIAGARLLPTSLGKDAQTVIRAGGSLGISSRAYGTVTKKTEAGKTFNDVNDDFFLKSPGDIVLSPSVPDALIMKVLEQTAELIDSNDGDEEDEISLNALGLTEIELEEVIEEISNMSEQEFAKLGEEDETKAEVLEELEKLRGKDLSGKKNLEQLKREHNLLKEKLKTFEDKKGKKEVLTEQEIQNARKEFLGLLKPKNQILNEEETMEKNKKAKLYSAYLEAIAWNFIPKDQTFEQFAEKMLEAEKNLAPEFALREEAKEQERKRINEELEKSGTTLSELQEYNDAVYSGYSKSLKEFQKDMKAAKKRLDEKQELEKFEPITPQELIEMSFQKSREAASNLNEENIRRGQLKQYHSDVTKGIFEGSFYEWLLLTESKVEGARKVILEREYQEVCDSGYAGSFEDFLKLQKEHNKNR